MRDLATQQILEEQYGCPVFLESVSASTTTAKTGALTPGSRLLIQPTAACYLRAGSSTVTATTTETVYLAANEKFYLCLRSTDTHVAFITGTGSATVNVFLME